MSIGKYCLCCVCLLWFLASVSASSLQEVAWQAAYEGELHCDPIATHNALVRLKDYHRFDLIPLSREQEGMVDRDLAQLVIPRIANPSPVNEENVDVIDVTEPMPMKKEKKKRSHPRKNKKAEINTDRIAADLEKRAADAYRFGRLEESQRFFKLALKLKPGSTEAKKGLEKIETEMK